MAAQKKQEVVIEDGAVYVLRAGFPIYIKTADVCAMTGKSNQWIGQLVSQGTLTKRTTPHGPMFEVTSAIRAYCDMLEARATKDEKSESEMQREEAKSAADVTLKVAKATIAKLEAKELQGKMHRAEDIEAIFTEHIFAVRGALLALPGRLAVDVVNASSAAEASIIIQDEVHKVLTELANYKYDPAIFGKRVRERKKWVDIDDDTE